MVFLNLFVQIKHEILKKRPGKTGTILVAIQIFYSLVVSTAMGTTAAVALACIVVADVELVELLLPPPPQADSTNIAIASNAIASFSVCFMCASPGSLRTSYSIWQTPWKASSFA